MNRFASAGRALLTSIAALALATACGPGEASDTRSMELALRTDRPLPEPDSATSPYRVVDVPNGGAVRGSILAPGDVPGDTLIALARDTRVCGDSMRVTRVRRQGDRLAEAVVWLADARSGKRIPIEKRFEVTHDRCGLEPRVQAVLEGGTLNVRNQDAAGHRTHFLRLPGRTSLRLVSQTTHGQVVPVQQLLRRPGWIEIVCDLHPGTRGWLHVFDHPYFAVTGPSGAFELTDVPPGRYRLVVWHPALGTMEREVQVRPGAETRLDIAFGDAPAEELVAETAFGE